MHRLDISQFKTAVNDSFVPLRVTSRHPDQFFGDIVTAQFGELNATRLRASGHAVERTPELIGAATRNYVKVSTLLDGHGWIAQDGRNARLAPGDIVLYDTARPYTLSFDDRFASVVLMFPQEMLRIPGGQLAELTAVRLAPDGGLGAMAAAFFARLVAQPVRVTGGGALWVAQSAVDLITALVTQELGANASRADPRRDRLRRVMSFIDTRLGDPGLDPQGIAAAHFISTRHLHGLFHDEGLTVSGWIRARRLQRCRRDLADPGLRGLNVSEIALRWGFANPAHFSRAFKERFGVSPSAFRAGCFVAGQPSA